MQLCSSERNYSILKYLGDVVPADLCGAGLVSALSFSPGFILHRCLLLSSLKEGSTIFYHIKDGTALFQCCSTQNKVT